MHLAARFAQNRAALVGSIVFLLIAASGLLAPWIAPQDPFAQDTSRRLLSPSGESWLGTDDFGRDILSRLLFGSRTVLLVAFLSIGLALAVGTTLGLVAGYRGGWVESLVMRVADVLLSLPLMLLAIVIVMVLGPGVWNLILAISISQVPLFMRLARSLTLSLRTREFIEAAVCLGAATPRIIAVHLLPNVAITMLVQATTSLALAMLSAAALNFLGLGIQPPSPDWGAMVSDLRRFVFDRPLLPFYPGAAIAVTVLSLNLLADGLIDLMDPTTRKSVGAA